MEAVKNFIMKHWPYVLAGTALVAFLVWYFFLRAKPDTTQSVVVNVAPSPPAPSGAETTAEAKLNSARAGLANTGDWYNGMKTAAQNKATENGTSYSDELYKEVTMWAINIILKDTIDNVAGKPHFTQEEIVYVSSKYPQQWPANGIPVL